MSAVRVVSTWAQLAVLVAGAVGTASVLWWALVQPEPPGEPTSLASTLFEVAFGLGFSVWMLAPFAGATALVVFGHRRRRPAPWRVLVALGAPAVVAMAWYALADFVDGGSSTDALIFIFLPFYQLAALGLCWALAALAGLAWRLTRAAAAGRS